MMHIPDFLPGEIVLHRTTTPRGEIFYVALVIGLFWDGHYWEYSLDFLPDHPQFDNWEIQWVNSCQLERIDWGMRRLLAAGFAQDYCCDGEG